MSVHVDTVKRHAKGQSLKWEYWLSQISLNLAIFLEFLLCVFKGAESHLQELLASRLCSFQWRQMTFLFVFLMVVKVI